MQSPSQEKHFFCTIRLLPRSIKKTNEYIMFLFRYLTFFSPPSIDLRNDVLHFKLKLMYVTVHTYIYSMSYIYEIDKMSQTKITSIYTLKYQIFDNYIQVIPAVIPILQFIWQSLRNHNFITFLITNNAGHKVAKLKET